MNKKLTFEDLGFEDYGDMCWEKWIFNFHKNEIKVSHCGGGLKDRDSGCLSLMRHHHNPKWDKFDATIIFGIDEVKIHENVTPQWMEQFLVMLKSPCQQDIHLNVKIPLNFNDGSEMCSIIVCDGDVYFVDEVEDHKPEIKIKFGVNKEWFDNFSKLFEKN